MEDMLYPPSDDSDDEDEVYEHIDALLLPSDTAIDNKEMIIITEEEGNAEHNSPSIKRPTPINIKPKVLRRMSMRVPTLPCIHTTDSKVKITEATLNELIGIMRAFPTPPTISHDAQHTTSNMIYNNKITDTAVKLVSGIGMGIGKFLSSSSSTLSRKPADPQQDQATGNYVADRF
jgi:hypothetical protein